MNRNEIMEILRMPEEEYRETVMKQAFTTLIERSNKLYGTAMLGYTNICKNGCLYCGMRAGNKIPRYEISKEDVIESIRLAKNSGYNRIFLISGEHPGYGFDNLLEIVKAADGMDMFITLACGEYSARQYEELRDAGANEYVIKFEMGQKAVFDRLNPSTNFEQRMQAIEAVKKSGMELASGNIVGYPGQTDEMIAEDIELMNALEISWAPVVPYMPAHGTPLAEEESTEGTFVFQRMKTLKTLSVLRLMMPDIRITAQQPGNDMTKGMATEEGNLDAIKAGGNILFSDLLPDAMAKAFRVTDHRELKGISHLRRMSELTSLELAL